MLSAIAVKEAQENGFCMGTYHFSQRCLTAPLDRASQTTIETRLKSQTIANYGFYVLHFSI